MKEKLFSQKFKIGKSGKYDCDSFCLGFWFFAYEKRGESAGTSLFHIHLGDSVLRITWNLTTTDKMIGHMIWVLQLEKGVSFGLFVIQTRMVHTFIILLLISLGFAGE